MIRLACLVLALFLWTSVAEARCGRFAGRGRAAISRVVHFVGNHLPRNRGQAGACSSDNSAPLPAAKKMPTSR